MFNLLSSIGDTLIAVAVLLVGGGGVRAWFILRRREQDYLYNLRSRELRMTEEVNEIKVDYYRQRIVDGKMEQLPRELG